MHLLKKKIYDFCSAFRARNAWQFFMVCFKIRIFDFFKVLCLPPQPWSKKNVWRQLKALNVRRSPSVIVNFTYSHLRVCVTYRCQAACRNCYIRGLEDIWPSDMTREDFKKCLFHTRGMGWNTIRFIGGEPTLHPEFTDFLELCYDNRFFVTLATNNLFDTRFLSVMERPWFRDLSINYNIFQTATQDQRLVYEGNLAKASRKNIPVNFSFVLDSSSVDEAALIDGLRRFRPYLFRVSLAMPDFKDPKSVSIFEYKERLFNQIIRLRDACVEEGILFYIYRPVPRCLFTEGQWHKLKDVFRNIAYTRCPLGFRGDYTLALNINPDLSFFPCSSVFIKGRSILDFSSRTAINQFYKNRLIELSCTALLEDCKECVFHRNFSQNMRVPESSQSAEDFFKDSYCQGGCLNYKWHSCCKSNV